MHILADFARAVSEAREAKHWSQEKVAELADISTRWYQQIEKGDVSAGFEICVRVARVLGLDLNQFLDEGDKGDADTVLHV